MKGVIAARFLLATIFPIISKGRRHEHHESDHPVVDAVSGNIVAKILKQFDLVGGSIAGIVGGVLCQILTALGAPWRSGSRRGRRHDCDHILGGGVVAALWYRGTDQATDAK